MDPQLLQLAESVRNAAQALIRVLPEAVFGDQWWDPEGEHYVRDLVERLRIYETWRDQGCIEGEFERTPADLESAEMWDLPPAENNPADLLAAQLLVVARTGAATWQTLLAVEVDAPARQQADKAASEYLDAREGWTSESPTYE